MKIFKRIMLGVIIVFALLQLFRPTRNENAEITAKHISKIYSMQEGVEAILDKACYDCHSDKTEYPWYAEIQPFAWWLNNHIVDGKKHLNFSQFGTYSLRRQYKKIGECIDEIKGDEMPLNSYTWIHKDAVLSDSEKTKLYAWCNTIIDTMKAKYPADSLISKKKK